MPRTTSAAVTELIDIDGTVTSLTPYIETANALVTEVCAPVTTYDAARLELIERWLSAHFYAVYSARRTIEKARAVAEHFQSKVGLCLYVTHYGQQAALLDTAGGLAALNKATEDGTRRVIGITYLGTPHPDVEAVE